MNEHVRTPIPRPTTQGAEGLPRWRWTLAEFERLIEAGILGEDDRVELIEGEIVPMSPKGNRHDLVKDAIAEYLQDHRPADARVAVESGWSPIDGVYHEPDIRIYPRRLEQRSVPGAELRLLLEVSDSSLHFDLNTKSRIYADLGVPEYWVVEAWSLTTHLHLLPGPDGYAEVRVVASIEVLAAHLLPTVKLKLAELQID